MTSAVIDAGADTCEWSEVLEADLLTEPAGTKFYIRTMSGNLYIIRVRGARHPVRGFDGLMLGVEFISTGNSPACEDVNPRVGRILECRSQWRRDVYQTSTVVEIWRKRPAE